MEKWVETLKKRWCAAIEAAVPYARQILRFLALPLCFFAMVNWRECRRNPLIVAFDLLDIFFRLGYFPDNYSKQRLWEVPRGDWKYYFGSPYNPFQKARLNRSVQPARYYILFEDKEVTRQLCESMDVTLPDTVAVVRKGEDPGQVLAREHLPAGTELIAKPSAGAAGAGILLLCRHESGWSVRSKDGQPAPMPTAMADTVVVQRLVDQHPDLVRVYGTSLNTVRMLTILGPDGEPRLVSSFLRFGTGKNLVDNWSAGGVAVGVDNETGRAFDLAYDRLGRRYQVHPDSGVRFADVAVPHWNDARRMALSVQRNFPYYRLLGHDIAISPTGPVLIELNAFPGLIGQEQTCGPLLKSPENLRDFLHYGLLGRRQRWALRKDIARLEVT